MTMGFQQGGSKSPSSRKATSRIDELGVRELVENLFEANTEYAEIIKIVKEKTGQDISDSALSRAYQAWTRRRMRAESIEREVETLTKALAGNPDLDIKKTVLGLFWKKVADRFAEANLSFDKADAVDMSYLLLRGIRTEQMAGQLDLQKDRLDLLKQRVKGVADKVEAAVKAKGLDPETIKTIREEIYGLAPVNI
jgi:tetratricopeptide (TPR) repeat protein